MEATGFEKAVEKAARIEAHFNRPGKHYRAMARPTCKDWVSVFVDFVFYEEKANVAVVTVYPGPPGKEPVVRVTGYSAMSIERNMKEAGLV